MMRETALLGTFIKGQSVTKVARKQRTVNHIPGLIPRLCELMFMAQAHRRDVPRAAFMRKEHVLEHMQPVLRLTKHDAILVSVRH